MNDKPAPADNIETRPPLEWVATTAARLAAANRTAGEEILAAEICAQQAVAIWRAAAVAVTGTYGAFDWWALAFEKGDGFEEAARAMALKPYQIHPAAVGCDWWDFNRLAAKLYPTAPDAARRLYGLHESWARDECEGWTRGISRCPLSGLVDEWPEHLRTACQGDPIPEEGEPAHLFSPWLARQLWLARQAEISRERSEAGRKAAAAKPAPAKPKPAPAKCKQPCKRHRWETTGSRRACRACGLRQVRNEWGDWVDYKAPR